MATTRDQVGCPICGKLQTVERFMAMDGEREAQMFRCFYGGNRDIRVERVGMPLEVAAKMRDILKRATARLEADLLAAGVDPEG